MSGGFFRGTSADQDTRFSNKQAKLMKSQKFAPELEHLVDIAKVKMDVVKPWIANRVTELLGFEDEVLINFIYGLLDGKEVNGKEVQISLTGFMEKNTGKFMKELWLLLLSAQNNASGVPQQFLDAKEEETRKKKAEMDWIANEIQMKKEKENRELEQERLKKMEGGIDMKASNSALDPASKGGDSKNEKEISERNGMRGRSRVSRSPHSAGRSPLSPRCSPSRSISKSFSNSRSYSGGGRGKSRSVSKSPESGRPSISSEQVYHSPRRRSFTPRRRRSPQGSLSPSWRRVPYYKRRSRSRSPYRSRSPIRHRFRSPYRRRSPSPIRRRTRRSPSPLRRRSPSPMRRKSPSHVRRRSPSPVRRRSPLRRRSPSPMRRQSPSPMRRRSPSPVRRRYQRSPSTPRRRSPSPVLRRPPIHGRGRSPIPSQRRSPLPDESSSPSPIRRRSPSPARRKSPKFQRSPVGSSREKIRPPEKLSPVARQPSSLLRLPQRDPKKASISRGKIPMLSPSSEKSPTLTESPLAARKQSPIEDRREDGDGSSKPSHRKSLHSPTVSKQKYSPAKAHYKEEYSPERLAVHSQPNEMELRKKGLEIKGDGRGVYPETREVEKSPRFERQQAISVEDKKSDEKKHSHLNNIKDSNKPHKSEIVSLSVEKVDHRNRNSTFDSGSEENRKNKAAGDKGKRKHKRSEREAMVSDDGYTSGSELEERKENKRRRKEEKKLRKEEKRRRHEERRRKREERRAEKLKVKNDNVAKMESQESDDEETMSGQKKLEIELRKKALESLKAKKGISH